MRKKQEPVSHLSASMSRAAQDAAGPHVLVLLLDHSPVRRLIAVPVLTAAIDDAALLTL